MEAGADLDMAADLAGTPLMTAIIRDNNELAGLLVEAGADVNVVWRSL